ncbi:hypothetical protein [Microbacterium immunditiarum]|uniref:Uncharacterized protein n=1 Tax=Microbacterium immunditiarum TaxID=337480 RepID=A0A7Y9KJ95_9MICO|nr:hypothetical protein [Microbacterium immunditiarum]NYE21412.1 hypothetical protein [Microbacterium immunditiarum]
MADSEYVRTQLLVTRPDRLASIIEALRESADELGWELVPETLGGRPVDPVEVERETRALGGVHPVRPHLVRILSQEVDADASPVDAARLLRRAKSRHTDLIGVELDRIATPDA